MSEETFYEFKSQVVSQTDLAVLLRPDAEETSFWIPKSLLSYDDRETVEATERDDWVEISVPQWLAEAKGMV